MHKVFAVFAIAMLGVGFAQSPKVLPASITVPREKISLACTDSYFKTERLNFLLQDENYACKLRLPLALRERWPGRRSYYVIPRLSLSLRVNDEKRQGAWIPLAPLTNIGNDPFHRVVDSKGFKQLEFVGKPNGKLSELAGTRTPEAVSAGGKVSVCVSPVYRGENPCVTFDITARFKVYLKN